MAFLLLFLVGDRPAAIVAIADATASDPLSVLISYGPLGVMIMLLAMGIFRTKWEVQALEKAIDRLRADLAAKDELIRAFQIQLTGHTLPALAQSARVFESIPKASSDVEELKRARDEIAALTRHLEELTKGGTP